MDFTKQFTINETICFSGIGVHTGKFSEVILEPLEENSGINFNKNGEQIPVYIDNIFQTGLCTSIKKENTIIYTVEHLLSALNGLGICNIKINVSGDEIPILDGSAKIFAEKIIPQIKVQNAKRNFIVLNGPVFVNLNEKFIMALPSDIPEIYYFLDYPENPPGFIYERFIYSPEKYFEQISPARTFGFYEDGELLKSKGFALGASYENTLVIRGNSFSDSLRFINEPAKHKILDLIGDIAFLGKNICAKIIAFKTGHAENIMLVKKILS